MLPMIAEDTIPKTLAIAMMPPTAEPEKPSCARCAEVNVIAANAAQNAATTPP